MGAGGRVFAGGAGGGAGVCGGDDGDGRGRQCGRAGDLYAQTKRALAIIEAALAEAGASMRDVVRTRMFVTDISRWEEAGRAHGEVFGEIRPATTMVEVSRLIDAAMLIEIEADAVVEG